MPRCVRSVAIVIVTVDEVEDRDELDEDIEWHVIEIERDADRHADADRGSAVIAEPRDAVVEVPVPEACTDIERQLERRRRHERDGVPQIVGIEMESVAVVIGVVDVTDAEVERTGLGYEVLAVEPGRLAELEAKTKLLVGLEAVRVATTITIVAAIAALTARPVALIARIGFATLSVGVIAIASRLVGIAIASRLVGIAIASRLIGIAIVALVRVVPLPGVAISR